jgi:hypothetical protein
MLIDCDNCEVRGSACAGCVVSVLLGAPPSGVDVDDSEQAALAVLADAGMVPRLRLVNRPDPDRASPDRISSDGISSDRPSSDRSSPDRRRPDRPRPDRHRAA